VPRGELQCPLCESKSITYTTPGNLYVRCPSCGWYRLTYLAHEHFFMGHGSPVLNGEQKRSLIAYVRQESAKDPSAPVALNVDAIKALLGINEK
jgi:hypothetical protein